MFDKINFAKILKEINEMYENQTYFAVASGVNRTYLSQYMNMKLDSPPTPKILMGIANASKGVTTYEELMQLCGYIAFEEITKINNSLSHPKHDNIFTVPILISIDGKLCESKDDVMLPTNLDLSKQYFGYRINDDSMLPLVGVGDTAIIEKCNIFESGFTYLISLDSKDILIRKIIEFKDYIELQTAFPYNPYIKIMNEEKEKRDFKVLGKVIKVENSSAFQ